MNNLCILQLLTCICVLASTGFAQWSNDPAVNTPICLTSNDQNKPMIASDGAGGALIVWEHEYSVNDIDIYAQRVNSSGVAQWTNNGVPICISIGHQREPKIIGDGAGGAIIVWEDFRSGTSAVFAQRVNAFGTEQWTAGGVAVTGTSSEQATPAITSDGAGGAIIAWSQKYSSTDYDIYVQRISSGGGLQWGSFGVALCFATDFQSSPEITGDGAGGAIVTWHDRRGGSNYDVYAQRVNSTGVPQWTTDGVAISAATNDQMAAVLCSDGVGGAVIAWEDKRNSADWDIFAQRINGSGIVQWTLNGVAIVSVGQNQQYTAIISDGSGGAIIAWEDQRGFFRVYAQRINASGNPLWTANGEPVSTSSTNQLKPDIVSDNAGGAIITWTEQVSSDLDVYAQRMNASGVPVWVAGGVAISNPAGSLQSGSVIASDGGSGAIITWVDGRNGINNSNIYAQWVNPRSSNILQPQSSIISIKDIGNDQGGNVRLNFRRSWFDRLGSSAPTTSYGVWRRRHTSAGPSISKNPLPVMNDTLGVLYDFLVNVPAVQSPEYNVVCQTLADSSAQGTNSFTFLVTNHTSDPQVFYISLTDTGYSVDNIAPYPPSNPQLITLGGNNFRLKWDHNRFDSDVAGYVIYRSPVNGFPVTDTTRLTSTLDSTVVDTPPTSAAYYYRITTVDVHGNESLPTTQLSPVLVRADVRFFLGGPYNTTTNEMFKTLNTNGMLASRYGVPVHPDAVDSVTVEVRNAVTAAGSTIRKFQSAWLLTDGTIRHYVDTTQHSVVFDVPAGSYYLVVHHANHLPVMSASFQALSDVAVQYDFSTGQAQAFGSQALMPVGSRYALYPGDVNRSGIVTAADANVIFGALNVVGYSASDANLSGIVTAADANIVFGNLNQAIQVP